MQMERRDNMYSFSGNLLELIAVQNDAETSQIHLKTMSGEQELVWRIDSDLAERLHAITRNNCEKYRYRLSLQTYWDAAQNQYFSSVTKTHRDHSEQIFFPCSENYVMKLQELKKGLTLNRFVSEVTSAVEPSTRRLHTQFNKMKHISIISICFVSLFVLGFFSYWYLNQTVFAKGIDEANESNFTIDTSMLHKTSGLQLVMEKSPQLYSIEELAAEIVTEEESLEHSIEESMEAVTQTRPIVELDQLINFHIPKGKVALTFDDGPSKYTDTIVDILVEYEAGATFFFIGENIGNFPNAVEYVHNNGYSIGNHSWDHAYYSKLSYEEQETNLLAANQLIEQIVAQPVQLFRPPYGAKNENTLDLMQLHSLKMVLWNRDTEDWSLKGADRIVDYVVESNASGTIILLHETEDTVQALPRILEYLQEQKLEIVNLK